MGKDIATYPVKMLFSYSLSHLPAKDKVRFYYALKGRDGHSGIVHQYMVEQLAKGVFLVPEFAAPQFEEFLTHWHCAYKKRKVYLDA